VTKYGTEDILRASYDSNSKTSKDVAAELENEWGSLGRSV